MYDYKIKKDTKKKLLVSQDKIVNACKLKPHFKQKNILDVKELLIIDQDLKQTYCHKQFDITFKRLTQILLSILENFEDEGDAIIALNEILHAKQNILDYYTNFLAKEEIKKMLKKLDYLESELKKLLISSKINQKEKSR